MAKKTPPFEEYPQWTEAKFWAFMRSGLRSKWMRWPPKWEVLNAASRPYKGPDKRKKKEYRCTKCKKWYSQKDVSVDHIIPAGALSSWEDLADFCRKLFVGVDKLRVLCNNCHASVTLEYNKRNPRKLYPREEASWRNMLSRCYNKNSTGYEYYGGKGVVVCDSWRESFWNFIKDMGDRPEGTSLDRIDVNRDYEPTNCRWASYEEQANNKSDNVLLSLDGVTKTLSEWAHSLGLKPNTLQYRLYRGWSVPQALGKETRTLPSKKVLKGELLRYVMSQLEEGRTQTDVAREIGVHSSVISRAFTEHKTIEDRKDKSTKRNAPLDGNICSKHKDHIDG